MTKINLSEFKYCFVEPVEAAGYKFVPYKTKVIKKAFINEKKSSLPRLHKAWNDTFHSLTEDFKIGFGPELMPTLKKLKKIAKKMDSLLKEVKGLDPFEDLEGALHIKNVQLHRTIYIKTIVRQQSKVYPPQVQTMTHALITYWNLWTGSKKKLSGFTPQMHEYRKILKDKKSRPVDKKLAKEGLLKIDVKANPGGAYIQRMLEAYYNKKYTNEQITTLLTMIYKWPDTDKHGGKLNPNPFMWVYDWHDKHGRRII